MSGLPPSSPEPLNREESTSRRALRYRVGLLVTLVGNLLVIVAFFSPWFDVFKLDDPSYVFPKRGYGPWTVLASGRLDSLCVVTWVFLLFILGMALSSLVLALTQTARRRYQSAFITGVLALVSLAMILVAVPGIRFDLSFSWPFLSSNVVYGPYLAGAGCLSVLLGLSILPTMSARPYSPSGSRA